MIVACQNCNRPFKTKPARIANGRGKYCSKQCAGYGSTKNRTNSLKEMSSLFCGKKFFAYPYEVRNRRRFCSPSCGTKNSIPSPEVRFYQKIKRDKSNECWIWIGSKTMKGYPQFIIGGRKVSVHRWAYQHFAGPIPDGMLVCHKCDIPNCVCPDHLFLGTIDDNQKDMARKGRAQKGEARFNAKLTEAKVKEIRMRGAIETDTSLAVEYGVSRKTISKIRTLETWKHVT